MLCSLNSKFYVDLSFINCTLWSMVLFLSRLHSFLFIFFCLSFFFFFNFNEQSHFICHIQHGHRFFKAQSNFQTFTPHANETTSTALLFKGLIDETCSFNKFSRPSKMLRTERKLIQRVKKFLWRLKSITSVKSITSEATYSLLHLHLNIFITIL